MRPIKDTKRIEYYGALLREMVLNESGRECEFDPRWVRTRGWKVVPAESMARIPTPDISRIVSALGGAGVRECVAFFNEPGYVEHPVATVASHPPSDMSTCYIMTVDASDFQDFNQQLGAFRSVLFSESRTWAISCTEWYNLFGAKPHLLRELLGEPVEQARRRFAEAAAVLARGDESDPLVKVSKYYAAL